MAMATFEKLLPAMRQVESVVFSGIGEPLMHPRLPEMIRLAKRHADKTAWVGVQTNGSLLHRTMAESLVAAGLDRICISIDSNVSALYRDLRSGGDLEDTGRAFFSLQAAKERLRDSFCVIGIEFVVMKRNYAQLPAVLEWAAERGADFAIVSQLIPYDAAAIDQTMSSTNTDVVKQFFQSWKKRADREKIDIDEIFAVRWKYQKSKREQRLIDFMEEMEAEAYSRSIPFHLHHLLADEEPLFEQLAAVFREARQVADGSGLELRLPRIYPKHDRQCEFVEEGSAFVSWKGEVHPCYFLWHRYSCYINGKRKRVAEKSFGNVERQDLQAVWNSEPFENFRNTVLRYEYPYCGSCKIGPCNLVEDDTFDHDCHTIEVPCGQCPWCFGLLQCLR